MRNMTKEMEEKPIEKSEDNRLDLKKASRKDKKRIKRERLEETMKDMNPSERRKYLLYYHKEKIIVSAVLIVLICFSSIFIYKITRPITLSYVVLNCKDQYKFNDDPIEQYAKDIGKYEGCQIKGNINTYIKKDEYTKEYEGNANSQTYINFMTLATADYYDVIITNDEGAEYCGSTDILKPLDRYLSADVYELVKDDIVKYKDSKGEEFELVIDISDTDFAKEMNVGYDDVYIGFPGKGERNKETAEELVRYLYR